MIRRWSCLNQLNNNFQNDFFLISKHTKINVFKNSVNFKKYKFKYTKFKRKAITRVFHISTLLIYTNVFKSWSKDYLYNKHKFKNEYLLNMFIKNFYFYNFNFIKNRNEAIFNNLNFIFCYLVKSRSRSTFLDAKIPTVISFLKNNTFSYGWFYNKPTLNQNTLPVFSNYESCLFPFSQDEKNPAVFDIEILFSFLNNLHFIHFKEFYTIILLFVFKNVYFNRV